MTGDAGMTGAERVTEDWERGRRKIFLSSAAGATIEGMEEVEGGATK